MAVHETNGCRKLLIKTLELAGKPLSRLSIGEMGNQRLKPSVHFSRIRHLHPLKDLLEFLGASHVSFDLNGKDGSLAYDLREPLPEKYKGCFDIVTNYGTLEHIGSSWREQRIAWWNFHNICKAGGLLSICGPHVKEKVRHGIWNYDEDWLRWLANVNKWEELHMSSLDLRCYWPNRAEGHTVYIYAIFRKTEDIAFVRPRKWLSPTRTRSR